MSKNSTGGGIVHTFEGWFAKAPALPKDARQVIVNITPWIALIFGILGILGAISGLGLLAGTSPLAAMNGAEGLASYGNGALASLIWLVSSVLLLAAYPGTKAKKMGGWNLLFWSELVSVIGSFVALSFISGIIGALIGFYLLFQIKSFYK